MRTREKGQAAFSRGIQLGAAVKHAPRFSLATDSNLVAEPMGSGLGHRCQSWICFACRGLLGILVTLGVLISAIELMASDYMNDQVLAEPVPSFVRAKQDLTLANSNKHEPNDDAALKFQLSLTFDVKVYDDEKIHISVVNRTGFFAAYDSDSHIRDAKSPSFEHLREAAVKTVGEAIDSWNNNSLALSNVRRLTDSPDDDEAAGSNVQSPYNPCLGFGRLSIRCLNAKLMKWTSLNRKLTIGKSSNWTIGTITFVSMMAMGFCAVLHMQMPYRHQQQPNHNQFGPRSNVHQSDAGPPFIGTATLKVPPSWCVERNHVYSLRSWIADLVLWASASDLDPIRHGPVAALQVQGTAKELVRELTPQQLQHGDVDQMTGQQLTGLMLLVTVLARRYAPLDAENTTKSISEFLAFRRLPGETIDSVLVRFEILRQSKCSCWICCQLDSHVMVAFAVAWTAGRAVGSSPCTVSR